MSRSITIPEYKNPFVVIINNNVYQYKSGETVEVPDEVAEAIEDALRLVPKPKRYLSKFAQIANGTLAEITESDLEGVEAIVSYAFAYCANLKKATTPNGVRSIGNGAFYSCSKLESVDMGDGIQRIEKNAFDWCIKLANVYLPETPPVLENATAFDNIKADCVFYCKSQASLDAYKAAPIWSTLAGTYAFVVEE